MALHTEPRAVYTWLFTRLGLYTWLFTRLGLYIYLAAQEARAVCRLVWVFP